MSEKTKEIPERSPEIAKMNERGQVSIPPVIRALLELGPGDHVAFKISKEGVFIYRVDLNEVKPYSKEEIKKFEKIASEKGGKSFRSSKDAIKYLNSL